MTHQIRRGEITLADGCACVREQGGDRAALVALCGARDYHDRPQPSVECTAYQRGWAIGQKKNAPKICERVAAQIDKLAYARHDVDVRRNEPLSLVHHQDEDGEAPSPRAVLHAARVWARSHARRPHVFELGAEGCRVMLELLG